MWDRGDVLDGLCTDEEYAAQYSTAVPKVGETYTQHPGTWQEIHWNIIFIEDKIAVGVSVAGLNKGRRCMFYSNGVFAGWKHDDIIRPGYRLQPRRDNERP